MADSRFFTCSGPHTLSVLLTHVQDAGIAIEHSGSADDVNVTDIAPLHAAQPGELSFFDNRKYRDALKASHAGACVLRASDREHAPKGTVLLLTDHPYAAYTLIAQLFYPGSTQPVIPCGPGVAQSARIGQGVTIAPSAVIADNAEIGDGCIIGPNSVIGPGVQMGAHCAIGPGCVLSHAVLGERVTLYPGVKVGQDGFGYAPTPQGLLKVPQLGIVRIADDVEIGANTTIDRGSGPDTVIGMGSKIDNLVQLGHNVEIGAYTIVVSQTGIAGSTKIGSGVMIGGQVGIAGHLTIGDKVQIAAGSGIAQDISAGETVGGYPSVPIRQWHRQHIALKKLALGKAKLS